MRFGTGIISHGKETAGSSRINAGDAPMTQNDPTDHALAAIAKILDKPETPSDTPDAIKAEAAAEQPELHLAEEILTAPPSAPPPPPVVAAAIADVEAEPEPERYPNGNPEKGSLDGHWALAAVDQEKVDSQEDADDYGK